MKTLRLTVGEALDAISQYVAREWVTETEQGAIFTYIFEHTDGVYYGLDVEDIYTDSGAEPNGQAFADADNITACEFVGHKTVLIDWRPAM